MGVNSSAEDVSGYIRNNIGASHWMADKALAMRVDGGRLALASESEVKDLIETVANHPNIANDIKKIVLLDTWKQLFPKLQRNTR